MSYKFTRCKRECGAMVAVTTFQKSEWKKNRGISTKYRGICDRCLTDDERKEVADEIIAAHKQVPSGAVNNKKKELTRGQPRIKYDKPLKVIGTREIFIKGKE